ncbi:MAG TPA: aldose epimerase family protein [Vicinamibacterales bacterium]|nr:aldose epimerase family protein [Vicinamibacterales bacterium]
MTRPFITQEPFGAAPDGRPIDLVTLRNANGVEVRVMNWGATVVSLRTPDRDGVFDDIVLGFDTAEPYFTRSPYFGSTIGRFANRIANARFELDGTTYTLTANDGAHHLHGGTTGWDKVLWRAEPFQNVEAVGVVYRHTSPDGDEGYPGTVEGTVTYALHADNSLVIDYLATTGKATVVNLTHHSYFNLGGARTPDVLGHILTIPADRYTPADATLIPTGALAPVEGTPFDFRTPTAIGDRINQDHPQLVAGRGYDHNWVIGDVTGTPRLVARVTEPTTGRTLEIRSTEPGLQFYAGNFLDGSIAGKGGRVYGHRSGFCLEPHHFPDSPNQEAFPSTVLRPGEEFRSRTIFSFGIQ